MLIPAILAVLSIIGLVLTVTSGLVTSGIDGLFMVLVCLLALAIFGGLALRSAADAGYLPIPARLKGSRK